MNDALAGSVVAVVGASGGLGRHFVDQLRLADASLILCGPHVDRLGDIAGPGDVLVELDLRDSRAGDHLVSAAQKLGRLDGVVNAAGVVAFGPFVDIDDVMLEELFLIDVLGPLWLTKRVVPMLRESKGWMVQVTGVIAEAPLPGMVAYSAAKAAMSAASRALFRELRRENIFVCDARPPHTETGLAERPLSGVAPRFPAGASPDAVVTRILRALREKTPELAGADFV